MNEEREVETKNVGDGKNVVDDYQSPKSLERAQEEG